MNPTSVNLEAVEKVQELIKDIEIAMLTTISDRGLVSRPMKTQDVEFDSNLWFLTKKDTSKFHELLHNQQVNVAYVGKSFVSIRGEAELVDSSEKVKDFWNPAYEKYLKRRLTIQTSFSSRSKPKLQSIGIPVTSSRWSNLCSVGCWVKIRKEPISIRPWN